jgi:hypothetical protein
VWEDEEGATGKKQRRIDYMRGDDLDTLHTRFANTFPSTKSGYRTSIWSQNLRAVSVNGHVLPPGDFDSYHWQSTEREEMSKEVVDVMTAAWPHFTDSGSENFTRKALVDECVFIIRGKRIVPISLHLRTDAHLLCNLAPYAAPYRHRLPLVSQQMQQSIPVHIRSSSSEVTVTGKVAISEIDETVLVQVENMVEVDGTVSVDLVDCSLGDTARVPVAINSARDQEEAIRRHVDGPPRKRQRMESSAEDDSD